MQTGIRAFLVAIFLSCATPGSMADSDLNDHMMADLMKEDFAVTDVMSATLNPKKIIQHCSARLSVNDGLSPSQSKILLRLRGEAYYCSKQYKESATDFDRLATLCPGDPLPLWLKGRSLARYDLQSTLVTVKALVGQHPKFYPGLASLSVVYLRTANPQLCVKFASDAIALKPEFARGYIIRCMAFYQLRRYRESLADLDKYLHLGAAETEHSREDLIRLRAALHLALGQSESALKDYLYLRKAHPESKEALDGIWRSFWYLKRYYLCVYLAEVIAEARPGDFVASQRLAASYAMVGLHKEAI
jgi:tetratricopeptide (TPR) repeat protein